MFPQQPINDISDVRGVSDITTNRPGSVFCKRVGCDLRTVPSEDFETNGREEEKGRREERNERNKEDVENSL